MANNFFVYKNLKVGKSLIEKNNSQEGLGLTIIEAMGCECAVIATSLDAFAEVIIDQKTGLFCPPSDEVSLAEKLEALINDRPFQKKIAKAGRKAVLAQYDWRQITEKYAKIYKNSIKSMVYKLSAAVLKKLARRLQ